jgi:hypothetical protein
LARVEGLLFEGVGLYKVGLSLALGLLDEEARGGFVHTEVVADHPLK